jgi:glycosyltransferase involved in cell wall biosynthesis
MTDDRDQPLVSICMPSFNGADVIDDALESALEQDYDNLEIVVVDDCSTDGTWERLRDRYADRIVVKRQSRRQGHQRNWNSSVRASSGEFVKFLHQDDQIEPDCVSKMARVLVAEPTVGLIFSRRRVRVVTPDEAEPVWLDEAEHLQYGFRQLAPINEGHALVEQLLASGFKENWVGEPSNVMVRRSGFERLGGFNLHVRQSTDLDLWIRFMADQGVAFVDEALATYTVSPGSLTENNLRNKLAWLDRLWILEGLAATEFGRRHPRVLEMRRSERRMALRTATRTVFRADPYPPPLGLWANYVRTLARQTFLRRHTQPPVG